MVKLRNAKYCNLKLLLIFLVIYGHLIEPQLHRSQILLVQYRAIYLFHMPMFCFLSGLFLNSCDSCKRQFQKCLSLYVLMQGLAVCFGKGKVDPLTPYWHLWYILSCSAWSGLGWLWYRYFRGKGKVAILAISVILGCLAGLWPGIGRALSLLFAGAFLAAPVSLGKAAKAFLSRPSHSPCPFCSMERSNPNGISVSRILLRPIGQRPGA